MENEIEITVTEIHSGKLLSTVYNGTYYKKLYNFYTTEEAEQHFREYVKEEESEIFVNQP